MSSEKKNVNLMLQCVRVHAIPDPICACNAFGNGSVNVTGVHNHSHYNIWCLQVHEHCKQLPNCHLIWIVGYSGVRL